MVLTDPNIAALHIRTSTAETAGTITVVNEGSIYGAGGAAGVANTGAAGYGGPALETSLDVTHQQIRDLRRRWRRRILVKAVMVQLHPMYLQEKVTV